ncbi:hypothetical protein BDW69DRAFT_119064 [Aspergillus filifer]
MFFPTRLGPAILCLYFKDPANGARTRKPLHTMQYCCNISNDTKALVPVLLCPCDLISIHDWPCFVFQLQLRTDNKQTTIAFHSNTSSSSRGAQALYNSLILTSRCKLLHLLCHIAYQIKQSAHSSSSAATHNAAQILLFPKWWVSPVTPVSSLEIRVLLE